MSVLALLNQKRQERKRILDAAGQIITKTAREQRSMTGDETQVFDRRHEEGEALQMEIERLERQHDAECRMGEVRQDARTAGREDMLDPRSAKHMTGGLAYGTAPSTRSTVERQDDAHEIRTWLLGGTGAFTGSQRDRFESRMARLPDEVRNLSAVTGSAGAYTIPQGFVYDLEIALKMFGGIMAVAKIIPTEMGNILPYPSMNDTSNLAEQTAENTNVTQTTSGTTPADPLFGVVNFGAYMFDSGLVKLPIQLLQDSAFDVENYVLEALQTRLGRKFNRAGTVGTGSSEPTGIVTAAPVGWTTASPTGVTYNELLELEHSVDPAYRPGAQFMFHDSTLKAIKKLTDSNGRPLFIAGGVSQGIQGASPDTIDGYGLVINQDMPTLGSSSKPMVYGKLSKFAVRMVRQISMIRLVERFAELLQVGFLAYCRFDSNLIDAGTHPVKVLQTSAT